ncbi:hypothetical protein [Rubritalea sp.]|uniref:hypothetical protein n=1 Tax=Rubritalea sp. TaxID=2109375 RepID=UPI003EF64150
MSQLWAQYTISDHEYPKGIASIRVESLYGTVPNRGFLPIEVELTNNSSVSRSWMLGFNSSDGSSPRWGFGNNQDNTMVSNYLLDCPAGEVKTYQLLVPIVTMFESIHGGSDPSELELHVEVNSKGLEKLEDSMSTEALIEWPSVLMSEDLFTENGSILNDYLQKSHLSGSSRSSNIEFAGKFQPGELLSDWRAYSGYDSIILSDTAWFKVDSAARESLLEWNRLGGALIIATSDRALKLSQLGFELEKGAYTRRSLGEVHMVYTQKNGKLGKVPLTSLVRGAGAKKSFSHKPFARQINEDYDLVHWGLYKDLEGTDFKPLYLVMILLVFGILVGPINLFVFAKSGKRHRLFITTPLIAIGTSLVLLVVIVVQDGFGGTGQRVQLVEVRADDGEYKAYVKQQQFCQTGVLFGGDFESRVSMIMSPVPLQPSRMARVTVDNAGGESSYRVQLTPEGMVAEGDWFQSRSQLAHYIEAVVPMRGRIALSGSAERPELYSSFDFIIEELLYQDANGKWFKSEGEVKQGAKVTMRELKHHEVSSIIEEGTQKFNKELTRKIKEMVWLRKSSFIALTQQAPGIDTLSSVDWEKTYSVFTGPVVPN